MLVPCPTCTRHLRDHETSCPFCKKPLDVMAIALATALALAGCKDRPRDAEVYGGPPPMEEPAPKAPEAKTDAGAPTPDSGSQKR